MKHIKLISLSLMLLLAISCSDDSDDNGNNTNDPGDNTNNEKTYTEVTVSGDINTTFKFDDVSFDLISNVQGFGSAISTVYDEDLENGITIDINDAESSLSAKVYTAVTDTELSDRDITAANIMFFYDDSGGNSFTFVSQSGSVTLDEVREDFCKGTFSVTAKSTFGDKEVQLSGTFVINTKD